MIALDQPRLMTVPMAGLLPVNPDTANHLLVEWGHKLGPVNRPFRTEAFVLELDGRPVSVAVSTSVVSGPVAGFRHDEVVELARLCSTPDSRWATRVMLRLWREACAPRWKCWPVKAAVSYSHNALHAGEMYRFDGWRKVTENAGSRGGKAWGRTYATDGIFGSKTLWIWEYNHA